MSELRAVLFDLGHTLVQYEVPPEQLAVAYAEVHELLASLLTGVEIPDGLMLAVARGVGELINQSYLRQELEEQDHAELFAEVMRGHGYELTREQLWEVIVAEHNAYARHLAPPSSTLATLGELRRRGLKLGFVSNATAAGELMRGDLRLFGLDGFFDGGVFSSEIGVRKPHPRIYQAVLDQLGVSAGEAMFVGDRVKEDVRGPQSLGMRAVLTHEFRQEEPQDGTQPDAIIRALPELLPIVDRLAGAPDRG